MDRWAYYDGPFAQDQHFSRLDPDLAPSMCAAGSQTQWKTELTAVLSHYNESFFQMAGVICLQGFHIISGVLLRADRASEGVLRMVEGALEAAGEPLDSVFKCRVR
jgi:hypothetical protein